MQQKLHQYANHMTSMSSATVDTANDSNTRGNQKVFDRKSHGQRTTFPTGGFVAKLTTKRPQAKGIH